MHVRLAAGARERLALERQHAEVVRDLPAGELGIEARRELILLGRDAGRIATRLVVVVEPCRGTDLPVLLVELGCVVAHRDQRGRADRDRIGSQRERLRDVGPGADAAGDDQLHLPVHPELLQRVDRKPRRSERRDARVLDEHVLRRGGPALHPVHDDHVGACLHGEPTS